MFQTKRLAVALLLTAAFAFSQVNVTSVTGQVTDPTGAAVPGADVTVVSAATGQTTKITTNERGEYGVAQLPAGDYRITASKQGFKQAAVEKVSLIVGVPGTVNIKLEVGQA